MEEINRTVFSDEHKDLEGKSTVQVGLRSKDDKQTRNFKFSKFRITKEKILDENQPKSMNQNQRRQKD